MRILITAGPTREYFDTVRFISNASTGKMGFALADAARRSGHQVVLIAGPVDLADPPGAEVVRVVSAADMLVAAQKHFVACQAAFMTAAVCDYRPAQRLINKQKKDAVARAIELVPTVDICATLGAQKAQRVVIGFAMEDHEGKKNAEQKLIVKNCDAIVLNSVECAGADRTTLEVLLREGGWQDPQSGLKTDIAARLVELVDTMVRNRARNDTSNGV